MAVKNKKKRSDEAKRNVTGKGEHNIENLSRMINASRAFRNLPPEMTMGRGYDEE